MSPRPDGIEHARPGFSPRPCVLSLSQPREIDGDLTRNRPKISLQQARLMELEDNYPTYQLYHRMYAILELEGVVDHAALEHALACLRARHDSLRFRLGREGDAYFARFDGPILVDLPVVDIGEKSDAEALAQVKAFALEEYDLERGPLYRAVLYARGAGRHWLLIAAHHLVFDYWSMGVVVRELGLNYLAGVAGSRDLPKPAKTSPASYAAWQRSPEYEALCEEQRPFWRELLSQPVARAELLFYPLERPDALYSHHQLHVTIPGELADRARALARRNGVSLYMALLSCFVLTLRYFGAPERVLIATPISCRTSPALSELVGMFSGFIPLVIEPQANRGLEEFLANVKTVVTGAISHQDVQFQEFAKLAAGELHYQFCFNMQNAPVSEFSLPSLNVSAVEVDYGAEYLDLSICLTESAVISGASSGVAGIMGIDRNLLTPQQAARIWSLYLRVLDAMTMSDTGTIAVLLEEVRNASG